MKDEPAFPSDNYPGFVEPAPGMSKRFYAAVQIATTYTNIGMTCEQIATCAFDVADALLKAEKEGQQ